MCLSLWKNSPQHSGTIICVRLRALEGSLETFHYCSVRHCFLGESGSDVKAFITRHGRFFSHQHNFKALYYGQRRRAYHQESGSGGREQESRHRCREFKLIAELSELSLRFGIGQEKVLRRYGQGLKVHSSQIFLRYADNRLLPYIIGEHVGGREL